MSFRSMRSFLAGLLLAIGIFGCGSKTKVSGAIPNVTQVMPSSVMHGSQTFSMTVTGNNFGTDATVFFNGNALQTVPASTTQVAAQVQSSDVAASGMVNVFVRSGGQDSNVVIFTIQ